MKQRRTESTFKEDQEGIALYEKFVSKFKNVKFTYHAWVELDRPPCGEFEYRKNAIRIADRIGKYTGRNEGTLGILLIGERGRRTDDGFRQIETHYLISNVKVDPTDVYGPLKEEIADIAGARRLRGLHISEIQNSSQALQSCLADFLLAKCNWPLIDWRCF